MNRSEPGFEAGLAFCVFYWHVLGKMATALLVYIVLLLIDYYEGV